MASEAIKNYATEIRQASTGSHYNCETCKDTELINDPSFPGYAIPCPMCAAKQRAARLQKICGLTSRERMTSLNEIRIFDQNGSTAKMVQAARNFIAQPSKMLTIYGTCGNAKTVVLQSIVNACLAKDITAIYITFYELVSWVREGYNADATDSAQTRINRVRDVPVLCIDELDKVKPTEWVRELETQLLDSRYRRGLSGECGTVFAMNGRLDDLPDWMSSRMRDGRNVVIENNDRDMRPLVRK